MNHWTPSSLWTRTDLISTKRLGQLFLEKVNFWISKSDKTLPCQHWKAAYGRTWQKKRGKCAQKVFQAGQVISPRPEDSRNSRTSVSWWCVGNSVHWIFFYLFQLNLVFLKSAIEQPNHREGHRNKTLTLWPSIPFHRRFYLQLLWTVSSQLWHFSHVRRENIQMCMKSVHLYNWHKSKIIFCAFISFEHNSSMSNCLQPDKWIKREKKKLLASTLSYNAKNCRNMFVSTAKCWQWIVFQTTVSCGNEELGKNLVWHKP